MSVERFMDPPESDGPGPENTAPVRTLDRRDPGDKPHPVFSTPEEIARARRIFKAPEISPSKPVPKPEASVSPEELGRPERYNPFENYFQLPSHIDPTTRERVYDVPGGVEDASLETPSYGPQSVKVPLDPREKWKYINNALQRLEATKFEGGGPGVQTLVGRAEAMIGVLQSPLYEDKHKTRWAGEGTERRADENFEIGNKLYAELTARKEIHKLYLNFTVSPDVKTVASLAKQIPADYFNALFRNSVFHGGSEVIKALQFYDKNAEEFFKAVKVPEKDELELAEEERNLSDLEKFRIKVRKYSAGREDINPDDYKWAQTVAERIWALTGRMAAKDTNVIGNFSGGNYQLRRLFGLKSWVDKNKDNFNLHPEILFPKDNPDNWVDLEQGDYFSMRLASSMYEYYKDSMPEGSEEEAGKRVMDLTGVKGTYDRENKSWQWDREVDLERVQWDKVVDYGVLGAFPLLDLSIYNWEFPEELRAKLVPKVGGLVRTPQPQLLFELKDDFNYQGGRQQDNKRKLFENTLAFDRSDETKKLNMVRMDNVMTDIAIESAVANFGLEREQAKKIKKKFIGSSLWSQVKLEMAYFRARSAIMTFIWELMKGIIAQGISTK